MGQRTRKLMTIHKVLHPKDDMHSMCYETKKEEDSLALRLALMQEFKDSNYKLKRAKKY